MRHGNARKCLNIMKTRGESYRHQHDCLVEWKKVNKTQSWVNLFALSLSKPTPIMAFAGANNVLHKMPFRHLVQCCKSMTEILIARVQNVLANTTCCHMAKQEDKTKDKEENFP
jgi:hypothetical protein